MGTFTNSAGKVAAALNYGLNPDMQWEKMLPARIVSKVDLAKEDGGGGWWTNFCNNGGLGQTTRGAIIVKSFEGNEYYVASDERNKNGHAEDNLIDRLKWMTKDYKRLPSSCKIIFYCNFSPCTKCMKGAIPKFVATICALQKNIQLSFVFDQLYCAHKLEADKFLNLFSTVKEAWSAYNTLQNKYNEEFGPVVLGSKLKQRVVFRLIEATSGYHGHHRSTNVGMPASAGPSGTGAG